MGDSYWFTVLAIVASVLSAGGVVSQLITWKRDRDKLAAEELAKRFDSLKAERASRVELARVDLEAEKVEREHTGRFQTQLLDRLALLEQKHDQNAKQIETLKIENARYQSRYDALASESSRLIREHETLKADHDTLKKHVERLEAENHALRARLARIDRNNGGAIEPETIHHTPRRILTKG